MIPCNKDCIYQCDGNCILKDNSAEKTNLKQCSNSYFKQNNFTVSENKIDRFAHGANVDKLNGIGNISAH